MYNSTRGLKEGISVNSACYDKIPCSLSLLISHSSGVCPTLRNLQIWFLTRVFLLVCRRPPSGYFLTWPKEEALASSSSHIDTIAS